MKNIALHFAKIMGLIIYVTEKKDFANMAVNLAILKMIFVQTAGKDIIQLMKDAKMNALIIVKIN